MYNMYDFASMYAVDDGWMYIKNVDATIYRISSVTQALEEEFARKLQEQEVFFKMSGESECLNPSTQSRISKFYPIPSVHSTGF